MLRSPNRSQVKALAVLAALAAAAPALATGEGPVLTAALDGVISPGTADYLSTVIERAAREEAACLLVTLNTPGGLEASMRTMVTAILNSEVPVVVYVAPAGARAASAGAFITLAAHVAAMAPGTNIGAAHPVNLGGGAPMDSTMSEKVASDAAAFIRSIAQRRGRNEQWAERAVRESISSSAREALDAGVVDLVSESQEELLRSLEGWQVETAAGRLTLALAGRPVVAVTMGWRHRAMRLLSDPNIAYIFLILGFYGILFELSNPGAILPGVVGGIFLILAFYALQTLPVNWAGLMLMLFALLLFIAEIKVTSFGLLAAGGVVSLVLGSVLLFDSPAPFLRVSLQVLVPVLVVTVLAVLVAIGLAARTFRRPVTTGREGMIGLTGEVVEPVAPRGRVQVRGELWWAEADEAGGGAPIAAGDEVEVTGLSGLTLRVRRRT